MAGVDGGSSTDATTREIGTKLDEQEIRDPAELTYISYSSRTGDPHVTLARAIYKINTRG